MSFFVMKLTFLILLICSNSVIHLAKFCFAQRILYNKSSNAPLQRLSGTPITTIVDNQSHTFLSMSTIKPEKMNSISSKELNPKSSSTDALLKSIETSTSTNIEGLKKQSTVATSKRNKVTQTTLKTTVPISESANEEISISSISSDESNGKSKSTDTLLKSIDKSTTLNLERIKNVSTVATSNQNKVSRFFSKTTTVSKTTINEAENQEIYNSSTPIIVIIVISSLLVMFTIAVFIVYLLKRRTTNKRTSKLNKLFKKNTSNKSGKSSNVESLHSKSHKLCRTQIENSELSWTNNQNVTKKATTQLIKINTLKESFKLSRKVANNFLINNRQPKSSSKHTANPLSSTRPKFVGTASPLSEIQKLKSISTKPNELKKYYVTKSGVCDIEPVSYGQKMTSPNSQVLKLSKTQTPLTETQSFKPANLSRNKNSIVYSNDSRKEDDVYEEVGGPFEVKNDGTMSGQFDGNYEAR